MARLSKLARIGQLFKLARIGQTFKTADVALSPIATSSIVIVYSLVLSLLIRSIVFGALGVLWAFEAFGALG